MKSFIIYFSKKGSVEQLFNQAWYLFPEEYLFRIQYWASRRMCWLNKNVNLLKNVYFLSYLKAYFAHFPLTDEVQNPNRTRQPFPLAYQLANDLFWVFSVLKLELMKPLLLMVFGFGHGFLSRIYFSNFGQEKSHVTYRNPFWRWRFPWTTLRFLFFKFKNVIFRFILKINIFLNRNSLPSWVLDFFNYSGARPGPNNRSGTDRLWSVYPWPYRLLLPLYSHFHLEVRVWIPK